MSVISQDVQVRATQTANNTTRAAMLLVCAVIAIMRVPAHAKLRLGITSAVKSQTQKLDEKARDAKTAKNAAPAASAVVVSSWTAGAYDNHSGISLKMSGVYGVDWASEITYHDPVIGDQILYVKSSVSFSLTHNDNNTVVNIYAPNRYLGVNGWDGVPNSGDEGEIHYKIDRDLQAHTYGAASAASFAAYTPVYSTPFSFDTLTYDGALPVLGQVGNNGGAWGTKPLNTTARFQYGMNDSYGNEWHTITYWDNDVPLLQAAAINVHRQGASDGHVQAVCVNPLTPVIHLEAPSGAQFYTTPVKTYFAPKIWQQTSYVSTGTTIGFVNLTNSQPIYYRLDGGAYQLYPGTPLVAGEILSSGSHLVEVKNGLGGVVLQRPIIVSPTVPAPTEQHGYLLWANAGERSALISKLHNTQPFKKSYEVFQGNYYQNSTPTNIADITSTHRGGWTWGAGMASSALNNAFQLAVEGPASTAWAGTLAKKRLLHVSRFQPVGFELTIDNHTPGKDFLNELGQTLQQYQDLAIAYDLLAAHFRDTDNPAGMTPIEEIAIRDGLGKIAKSILQFRENYNSDIGGGDSHWRLGYDLMLVGAALAMPTYQSSYYGVSGGDFVSTNSTPDGQGYYWNPFQSQGVTWLQAATDSQIATPGYPGINYPPSSDFLYSMASYWSGPNDFVGDGDRYAAGPVSPSLLVDLGYGGLANAEMRVEMTEMDGYEAPFVARLAAADAMRKIKGDVGRKTNVERYLARHLLAGVRAVEWDAGTLTYSLNDIDMTAGIYSHNQRYSFAGMTSAQANIAQFLNGLYNYYFNQSALSSDQITYYEDARKSLYSSYGLALMDDPANIPAPTAQANRRPVIKPLYKHVVKPGETISKTVLAVDFDDDAVTIQVNNLPAGASYDSGQRLILWTPGAPDEGVHLAQITASDGVLSVTRPFPMIVKSNAGSGPVPSRPQTLTASLNSGLQQVTLNWLGPSGTDTTGGYYLVYRNGELIAAVSALTTSFIDDQFITGVNVRYHVSYLAATGAESSATATVPAYFYLQ